VTIFVDSSVWFAAVFEKDAHHEDAKRMLAGDRSLITTDHVLIETWLLLRSRFNRTVAETFCGRVMEGWCRIESAAFEDLTAAEVVRRAFPDQRFSLIDRTSFVVMGGLGINRVASFDNDFVIYRYGANRERAFEVLR
jgi:predicted nucleic acid-binding protein